MSYTSFPQNGGLLIGEATKMYNGVITTGPSVPIVMIDPAVFHTQIATFTQKDGTYNDARTALQAAYNDYTPATAAIYTWLLDARKVLVIHFGDYWSADWAQAGFINNSTAIPTKIDDRIALTLALAGFFTKNPSYEVAVLEVTAAKATALRTTALTTQDVVTRATQALKDAATAWQTAYDALTQTMLALVKNLEGKLGPDDPRWLSFGLPMPSTPSTPGQPVNVTAHQDGNANIIVTCDPVQMADRYRARTLVVGVDTKYSLAASSLEPIMTISGVEPGRAVQIIVQAVNGSLQGVASDPIIYTIVLAAPRAAEGKKEEVFITEAPAAHSNGNGNGHRAAHAKENGAHARHA